MEIVGGQEKPPLHHKKLGWGTRRAQNMNAFEHWMNEEFSISLKVQAR
jgi:hypothetical protein